MMMCENCELEIEKGFGDDDGGVFCLDCFYQKNKVERNLISYRLKRHVLDSPCIHKTTTLINKDFRSEDYWLKLPKTILMKMGISISSGSTPDLKVIIVNKSEVDEVEAE